MRNREKCLSTLSLAMACVVLASCVSTADVLVNKEPGYLYGSAFAPTQTEAEAKAYDDLIYNVFMETGSARAVKKSNFKITPEMREAFAGFKLKPHVTEKKSDSRHDAVYRLSQEQWQKAEAARIAQLDKTFGEEYLSLKANPKIGAAAKIKSLAALAVRIRDTGAENKITGDGSGTLEGKIDVLCRELSEGVIFKASPSGGLVKSGSQIVVTVTGANDKPLAGYPVSITWKTDAKTAEPVAAETDDKGTIKLPFPSEPEFANAKTALEIVSALAAFAPSFETLAKLDAGISLILSYRDSGADKGSDAFVKVAAGEYAIGSVKHDKRAGSVEKPRKEKLGAFSIAKDLVTNADYGVYLDAIDASPIEYPDYWENPDFNKPDQPVIGVSLRDAEKYAEWLSGIKGAKFRLPTEAEYEVAARGGAEAVYPWGDQLPSDGARATFSANSKTTTAVGSRPNGKNPIGLNDMSGNVWQWTTSSPNGTMSGNQEHRIVKGGSYLDGQYELRISNRVLKDPEERYPDVGFRLVSEVNE